MSTFVCRYHSYPYKFLHILLYRSIQLVETILKLLSALRTDYRLMSYSAQKITFCQLAQRGWVTLRVQEQTNFITMETLVCWPRRSQIVTSSRIIGRL